MHKHIDQPLSLEQNKNPSLNEKDDLFLKVQERALKEEVQHSLGEDHPDVEKRKQEIEYNKAYFRDTLSTLWFVLSVKWDTTKDTIFYRAPIRMLMETYVKLKTWWVDMTKEFKQLGLDHDRLVALFDMMHQIFLDDYEVNAPKHRTLIQQYQERQKLPKKKQEKTPMNLKKVEDAVKSMTDFYLLKNMHESGYVSNYTPLSCEDTDFPNIKILLDYYAPQKKDLMEYVEWYIGYSKDKASYLQQFDPKQQKEITKKYAANPRKTIREVIEKLSTYYKLKLIYDTRSNESLTDPQTLEENKKIASLLDKSLAIFGKSKAMERIDY